MTEFVRKAMKFSDVVKEAEQLNDELGRMIVDALKPIIPDLENSVGWQEAGVDCIALLSDNRRNHHFDDDYISLDALIWKEIISPLEEKGIQIFVDTPFGVYVHRDEVEEVRKRLRELISS